MNPYSLLPDTAFWRQSVASRNMLDIRELWRPKFNLQRDHKIATFGSCFAQHIGKALEARSFSWLNTEPAPLGLSPDTAKRFNYSIFSCRTGNIYTASLLEQWVHWALDKSSMPEEYWETNGRIYDPFRPTIEPDGFTSVEEMKSSRVFAIRAFRQAMEQTDVLVFTLGLTESWVNKTYGYEYPLCPGTAAGEFCPESHGFANQRFGFVKTRLLKALESMREVNPRLEVILTVSPVPLTATNSQKHVLVATMESKSTLRAVAGELAADAPWIDYFPSYEIICSPPFRATFFEPNLRNINHYGVAFVMDSFFDCLKVKYGTEPSGQNDYRDQDSAPVSQDDAVCEEEILAAFRKVGDS